mmetsp:Transcript_41951/g.101103  ORF Transcript_41951/g.101103 Transcript_41951/m.101103 type:complete len:216 (-) Transcript_41951:2610-3257(-)
MDSPVSKFNFLQVLMALRKSSGLQPDLAHSTWNASEEVKRAKMAQRSRNISFGRNSYWSGFFTLNSKPLDPTSLPSTCINMFTRRGHNSSNKNRLRISLSVFKYPNICMVLLHNGRACLTSRSLSSNRLVTSFCCSSVRLAHSVGLACCSCAIRISGSFCMTVAIKVLVSLMIPLANLMKDCLFWVIDRKAGRCSADSHKYLRRDEILARWLILS